MPKNTTKKNSKGTKSTTTKKVETKIVTEKVPAQKVTKKVETKKTPAKKEVETKTEVKKVVKEEKGNKETVITKLMNNTPFVVASCVIILLVAILIFVLCIKRVPTTSDGKEILATINGKTITADDLYLSLKENYGTDELINVIDSYIADKEVKITKENEKYVKEVVDYYKEYAEYYGVDLTTFLANYVGVNGITTEDEFHDYVLKDYKKTLAVTNYIASEAKEEDLKKYYKENYSDKLTVKHILIEVDSEADDQDKADKEAYNKAVELIKELDKTSSSNLDAKFEELAEDNSDDTATYSKGGLMENFSKGDVVESFWKASEELKDGEYTKEPVKSTYGYHIILKVSSTPVEKYSDIKDEVKNAYAESLLANDSTLFAKKWDELRKEYKLSIKDDLMKKAYKNTVEESTKIKEETEKTEEN